MLSVLSLGLFLSLKWEASRHLPRADLKRKREIKDDADKKRIKLNESTHAEKEVMIDKVTLRRSKRISSSPYRTVPHTDLLPPLSSLPKPPEQTEENLKSKIRNRNRSETREEDTQALSDSPLMQQLCSGYDFREMLVPLEFRKHCHMYVLCALADADPSARVGSVVYPQREDGIDTQPKYSINCPTCTLPHPCQCLPIDLPAVTSPQLCKNPSAFSSLNSFLYLHSMLPGASYPRQLLCLSRFDSIFLVEKHFRSRVWCGGVLKRKNENDNVNEAYSYSGHLGYINRNHIICVDGLPLPFQSPPNTFQSTTLDSSPRNLFWNILYLLDFALHRKSRLHATFYRDGNEDTLWLLFLLLQLSCDLLLRRHLHQIDEIAVTGSCEPEEGEKMTESFRDLQQLIEKALTSSTKPPQKIGRKRARATEGATNPTSDKLEKEKKDTFWTHGTTYTAVMCARLITYQIRTNRYLNKVFLAEFLKWTLQWLSRVFRVNCDEQSQTTPFVALVLSEIDSVLSVFFAHFSPKDIIPLYNAYKLSPTPETDHVMSIFVQKCYSKQRIPLSLIPTVLFDTTSMTRRNRIQSVHYAFRFLIDLESVVLTSSVDCVTPQIHLQAKDEESMGMNEECEDEPQVDPICNWRIKTFGLPWIDLVREIGFTRPPFLQCEIEHDDYHYDWGYVGAFFDMIPTNLSSHFHRMWLAVCVYLLDLPLRSCISRTLILEWLTASLAKLFHECVESCGKRRRMAVRMAVDLCALWNLRCSNHDDSVFLLGDDFLPLLRLFETLDVWYVGRALSPLLSDAYLHSLLSSLYVYGNTQELWEVGFDGNEQKNLRWLLADRSDEEVNALNQEASLIVKAVMKYLLQQFESESAGGMGDEMKVEYESIADIFLDQSNTIGSILRWILLCVLMVSGQRDVAVAWATEYCEKSANDWNGVSFN
jgi:hypothetical protein